MFPAWSWEILQQNQETNYDKHQIKMKILQKKYGKSRTIAISLQVT